MNAQSFWAIASGGRVVSEDGALVATFTDAKIAEAVVDDHNIEIEINEDYTPEKERTREQERVDRVAAWKREDPDGAAPLKLLSSSVSRLASLLSLKAPRFIIAKEAQLIEDRAHAFAALFTDPEDATDA